MDLTALVFLTFCILAIVGVLVYFAIDYSKYKKTISDDLTTSDSKLTDEKVDRVSNVKYVVDQINGVNNDIYSQVIDNRTQVQTMQDTQSQILGGLSSFMTFSSNVTGASSNVGSTSLPLLNLPGTGNVDVQLIKHVTATMGLTANDLSSTNSVKFCSQLDPTRCIQIPDQNGNLYLTSMANSPTSSIIMDTSNVSIGKTGSYLANNPSGLAVIGSNTVQIGASVSATSAALGDAIVVDPTGAIRFNAANGTTIGQISKDASTNSLIVQSSNVIIKGNLDLRGGLFYKSDANGSNRTQVTI